MKIIVGGMRRCGSTLVYNALRLLYINSGCKVKGFLWDYDNSDMSFDYSEFNVQIMKRHYAPFTELVQWADKIFVPIRDLRDIICSDIKFGHIIRDEYSILNACAFNVNMFNFWKKHGDLICVYEDWVNNPNKYMKEILETLNMKTQEKNIDALCNLVNNYSISETNNPDSGFNKESLLFPNHMAGGGVGEYKEFLSSQEISLIEDHFKNFLIENGYQ